MTRTGIWAVVPVKQFDLAKQRLAAGFPPAFRQRLAPTMLRDVLAALAGSRLLGGIAVVTVDPLASSIARAVGARIITAGATTGHTGAVMSAAGILAAEGVTGMVTMPGDIPGVTAAEIDTLLGGHGPAPAFSIVPAHDNRGSNAIVCSPPDLIQFAFGDDSYLPHLAAARDAGLQPRIVPMAGIGMDIDTPDDLRAFARYDWPCATQRFLNETGALATGSQLTETHMTVEALLHAAPLDAILAFAASGGELDATQARRLAECEDLSALIMTAGQLRDSGHGDVVSYSRKVFIPLTHLCRDSCHYCTFANPPRRGQAAFMTREQVLTIALQGAAAGCKEALFTLGDKPEQRYAVAAEELEMLGHPTTLSYLKEMAALVLAETGLLPHINAGVMTGPEMADLRTVSVSQGIMLETASNRLSARGGPHFGSPDKHPAVRLQAIRAAGEAAVPFTSGLLIGIGETRLERIDALLALRDLHARYGHLQELIVQNFRAKPGTRMAAAAEPSLDEHLWTIAVTRILFGPAMNIQAPPNLRPNDLPVLIAAGINDWGGVSPVTPDHVNPEAPWPEIQALAQATSRAGKHLVERLAIYPGYAKAAGAWLDRSLRGGVLSHSDAEGFARPEPWMPGADLKLPQPDPVRARGAGQSALQTVLDRAWDGAELAEADIVRLFQARGEDFDLVCDTADRLRQAVSGDGIAYVVTRNINYTNVCSYRCKFCAFSKGKLSENLRGRPYDVSDEEIARRVREAWARGATEVCLQGGIHPDYTGETYLRICRVVKAAEPDIHIHAFSPLEISHGARTLGLSVEAFLGQLREAGLSSLPGTAAEILDDEVRAIICPDKINTAEWLDVMSVAHRIGLRSTATIMFGHVDHPVHWARHLLHLRRLQARTGGFTEFVPLPFVPMETPIYLQAGARMGPTFRESVLMHAVARLALNPLIPNIQTSWVKMGPEGVKAALRAGANDLGGTLMDESITRAAGAMHGQELSPEQMQTVIRSLGRAPRQRTTLYGQAGNARVAASFDAAALAERINAPTKRFERRVREGGQTVA